jgi:hypothetical protein
MPKSKHRHKGSGKSVKKPGQVKQAVETAAQRAELRAFSQFRKSYTFPFYEKFSDKEGAGFMLDLIYDSVVGLNDGQLTFSSVTKADLFEEFTQPTEGEFIDDPITQYTADQAEEVIAFLLDQDMIEVDGDQIMVASRFREPS